MLKFCGFSEKSCKISLCLDILVISGRHISLLCHGSCVIRAFVSEWGKRGVDPLTQ